MLREHFEDARCSARVPIAGEQRRERALVGGRITVYESLLDRGRREAIVRMKTEARRLGATMIFNVRLETSSLSEDQSGRAPMFSAEFIAYGTALVPAAKT